MQRSFKKNIFKNCYLRILIFIQLFMVFSSFSCSLPFSAETKRIKLMNWNLETFFDAQFDGNEYTEFSSAKSGWSKEKYEIRLNHLAQVISELDADVVVMEELEKEGQLMDIYNHLAGSFNLRKTYKYGFFAKDDNSSIGCGILSRLPLSDISVHSLKITSEQKRQPSMRPIIQFSVHDKTKSLVLFVNHWKSKSGGAEESDVWRNYQEEQLSRLMAAALEKNNGAVACGDFNRDISEFRQIKDEDFACRQTQNRPNVILRGKNELPVFSPWLVMQESETGSYYFNEGWEKIDHIFSAGEVNVVDFKSESAGSWADSEGKPKRYKVWSGSGYSDHLPITCTLEW